MSGEHDTCLPVAAWFLYSEAEEPLGQMYQKNRGGDAIPAAGDRLEHEGRLFEVVRYTELRASCAMRRFRVVVRPIIRTS